MNPRNHARETREVMSLRIEQERCTVLELHGQGKSPRMISETTGISFGSTSSYIRTERIKKKCWELLRNMQSKAPAQNQAIGKP